VTSRIADDANVRSSIALLSAWIESQMAYSGLPGLSIGVLHDQELIWARGFGQASVERGEPATEVTLYRIASITKLFTSTAIMQLRDAGKLRLDDPVAGYLPWFRIEHSHPDAPAITIRHLLTHTAGLPREAGFPYWDDGAFPAEEQIRERLPELRTALPTETAWKYSNLGLAVAGEIVAAVSGQPYAQYVTASILEPLGMRHTWVATPPADLTGLATGYTRRLPGGARSPAPFTDTRGIRAAANMTTSVTDLARFAMLQFRDGAPGGAQILRSSTLREMHRVHWLEPDWAAGWGLGFRVERVRDRTYIGHGGSLRGYRTLLRLRPADRVGVIVLTNADDGNPLMFAEKAFHWVAPAIVAAVPAPTAPALPDGWERYAGKYRNPWSDIQVLVVNGGLAMIDPSLPEPTLGIAKLRPVGPHTFRMESTNGYTSHEELVVFELDAAGRVTRMRVGDQGIDAVVDW
jgi:CubicO group peptidase (beta-lactamase class C family)